MSLSHFLAHAAAVFVTETDSESVTVFGASSTDLHCWCCLTPTDTVRSAVENVGRHCAAVGPRKHRRGDDAAAQGML
jgi:hypothetical protein